MRVRGGLARRVNALAAVRNEFAARELNYAVLIVLGDFYSPQGNWCFVTAVYLPLLSVYR